MVIEMKKLAVFRDLNIQRIVNKSTRETSAHRKIELMMPFYIIKKLVQSHKGRTKEQLKKAIQGEGSEKKGHQQ